MDKSIASTKIEPNDTGKGGSNIDNALRNPAYHEDRRKLAQAVKEHMEKGL